MNIGPETNDVRERMQEIARTVQAILPPGTGFIVMAFDFDTTQGAMEYVSNAQRKDVIKAMGEFIAKTERTWGKHVKDPLS